MSEAEALAEEVRKKMAPKGELGLNDLLDEKRLKYCIPDKAFEIDAVFDRIYVAQVADHEEETYLEGGSIVMPDTTKRRKQDESCRGVLLSAGLEALDHLRSNGMDLGHTVRFLRLAVWRMEVDRVNGKAVDVMVLRDGDVTGSEDLYRMRKAGRTSVEWDPKQMKHFYIVNGIRWDPVKAFIDSSM